MGTYADATDVVSRASGRPLTEETTPSLADVEIWIGEAEAELTGLLASLGITSSYPEGSRGAIQIRGWVADYVAGLLRRQYAGGEEGNKDGEYEIDRWRERLRYIAEHSAQVGAALDPVGVTPSAAVQAASHVTDAELGLSASDFEPTFTIKGTHY